MRSVVRLVLPLVLLGLFACGGATGPLDYPEGPDGGKKLVEDLMKADDKKAFIMKLEPKIADIEALFEPGSVKAIEAHVAEMYGKLGDVGMKPDQTEVIFFSATAEDFQKEAEPAKKFPGGYKRAAAKFKPGVTWYGWKYVKPGESLGMAFDGLAHVNGRWVWIPKPFRALKD